MDIDIDSESSKRRAIFECFVEHFSRERCLNIATFRTETAKAATQTACRGLGIDSDIARELSSLIPMARGYVWSVKECLEGNEDNGFQPVRDFVKKVGQYPMLLETIQEIEGLISGLGVHASGFYIFGQNFLEQNSLMIAPNGTWVTCWDMKDSDWCGALKVDILTIKNLDCIHKTMDLLAEDGIIQNKETIKATYDAYLHPKKLDFNSPVMWDLASDGKIINLFQYDTRSGGEAIRKIRPRNVSELSIGNSAMRLMGNEDMVPIDRFVTFKADVSLWYQEMADAGLTEAEQKLLETYLLTPNFGCSIEQEDMMRLLLEPKITGFTFGEAHQARKAVAKKSKKLIEEFERMYWDKGEQSGASKNLLNYIWKYCIKPQLG